MTIENLPIEAQCPPVQPEATEIAIAATQEINQRRTVEQQGWLRRNLLKLSLGAFVVGTGVTLATNPINHLEKEVVQAAPWAGSGLLGTEIMWTVGAGAMAVGAGKKIGNPLTLRARWSDISHSVVDNPLFKAGLAVNTVGALGTAGIVAVGAGVALPPETWPGAIGVALGDMAGTVAFRTPMIAAIKAGKKQENQTVLAEKSKPPKVSVRKANLTDIDRLADIDLALFNKAYGQTIPEKEEVKDMLTQRYNNNPGWMFVAEVDGEVEGFVTGFLTDKPAEQFVSWEESTNNGTLEDRVVQNGRYVYVANMTIKHKAVKLGAEDMLLAQLFANGIQAGAEYGYFVSRMPHFGRWLKRNGMEYQGQEELQEQANRYAELRNEKGQRVDVQLRMYEEFGFELGKPVANAFEDAASLDFGVVCKAYAPTTNKFIRAAVPLRWAIAGGLRQLAKHPKLLKKVL